MTLISDMAAIDADLFEDLGEPMVFDGKTEPVFGIFNDSYVTQAGGENVVEGRAVMFTCRESDLPELVKDLEVTRTHDGAVYRYLSKTSADEAGVVNLHLGST